MYYYIVLRSADHGELDHPHINLATYGGWESTYTGPTTWISLPNDLKTLIFHCQPLNAILKPFSLSISTPSTFEEFHKNALHKFTVIITFATV